MKYNGKELSDFSSDQLSAILKHMQDAEAKREEVRSHEKFKKMEFPPINPEFLKIKIAIEEEIRNRKNVAQI